VGRWRAQLRRDITAADGRRVRTGYRPGFAPETPEGKASIRGDLDKSARKSLNFFGERSLGKGEVVGSISTAPTR